MGNTFFGDRDLLLHGTRAARTTALRFTGGPLTPIGRSPNRAALCCAADDTNFSLAISYSWYSRFFLLELQLNFKANFL
jgi:hypothetical protein